MVLKRRERQCRGVRQCQSRQRPFMGNENLQRVLISWSLAEETNNQPEHRKCGARNGAEDGKLDVGSKPTIINKLSGSHAVDASARRWRQRRRRCQTVVTARIRTMDVVLEGRAYGNES
ncbi:hypothetical protein BDZ89DRAFT_1064072 [Hymenopellis radicata]|nr:hypothetical protein BDZ89DRAFT_1064072 [Hymenopellis radicata]